MPLAKRSHMSDNLLRSSGGQRHYTSLVLTVGSYVVALALDTVVDIAVVTPNRCKVDYVYRGATVCKEIS